MQMWVASYTKTVSMTGEDEQYVATEPTSFLQIAASACFMAFDLEGDHEIEIHCGCQNRLSATTAEVTKKIQWYHIGSLHI
jgi:hypothetical protein